MKRSQLENKANKTKDPKDILNYKNQLNYVIKLYNQPEQEHFDSLNPFLDSKTFWKSFKPYFSNKHCFGNSNFAFSENGQILPQNFKITKMFNSFFGLITDSLELFDQTLKLNISD